MVTPLAGILLLPLLYLNTHVHELSHAVAGLAAGGQVQEIRVFHTGAGVALVSAGGPLGMLITASAGYLGASLVGAALILFGRTPQSARNGLLAMAIALGISMVLWVRGDAIGVAAGVFWVVALAAGAKFLKGDGLIFAAQFVGVQQCLNAFRSLFDLLHLSAFSNVHSDAMILEQRSGVPALAWAAMWTIASAALLTVALRKAWLSPAPRGGSPK
jgi:hypothetical protein